MNRQLITKQVYMSQKQARLINQIYEISKDCFALSIYYELMKQFPDSKKSNDWYKLTRNGYYDLSILHWCKLFGSENNEPTHYSNLVKREYAFHRKLKEILGVLPTRSNLKSLLLSSINYKEDEYNNFWTKTVDYRNRGLIHAEHNPDIINNGDIFTPVMTIIPKAAYFIMNIINLLCAQFPSNPIRDEIYRVCYQVISGEHELKEYLISEFSQGVKYSTEV